MKNLIKSITLLMLAPIVLSSCGVMFGGSRFNGTIIAKDHPKADIYVNGTKVGRGTAVGLFKRNSRLNVELKQEGCPSKSQTYTYTFRTGNFILSVFMWGVVGGIIDLASGASFKPDHRGNPSVQRVDVKNYTFIADYSGCPN